MFPATLPAALPARDQAALAKAFEAARARWPNLTVAPEAFANHFMNYIHSGVPITESFSHVDAAELYLALACASGNSDAIACFEDAYFPQIDQALTRMKLDSRTIDDVKQAVRWKLFVARENDPPNILKYAGRGQLAGLVRVAAVRAALTHLERQRHRQRLAYNFTPEATQDDHTPELALIKHNQRGAFKHILYRAIRKLASRERTLLRLKFVQNLSIDDLATLYRVHRATAARRLLRARDQLIATTQELVLQTWKISEDELPSLGDIFESQISLSLERLLQTTTPPT